MQRRFVEGGSGMENKEKQKKAAAMAAASYIQDQMTIGLGTGSTALYLIHEAGSMFRAGRRFQAVATSEAAETLAISLGIPIIRPEQKGWIWPLTAWMKLTAPSVLSREEAEPFSGKRL